MGLVCEGKQVNSDVQAFGATKMMVLSFVDMRKIVREAGLGGEIIFIHNF